MTTTLSFSRLGGGGLLPSLEVQDGSGLSTHLTEDFVPTHYPSITQNTGQRTLVLGLDGSKVESWASAESEEKDRDRSLVLKTIWRHPRKRDRSSAKKSKTDLPPCILNAEGPFCSHNPPDAISICTHRRRRSKEQLGAPHCADPFNSRNSHTVPNDSDSMNSWTCE